jgi:hypothetical protein
VRDVFEYAIIRIVPDVEREEFVNVGVVFFCAARGILRAVIELDEERLRGFASDVDMESVRQHLEALSLVCGGGDRAGPLGLLPIGERWRWLVAPRSTILQTSPPHAGLSDDPEGAVARLLDRVVRRRESREDR